MPRGPRKYDPKAVEHEYVTGDVSLRELAKRHDVAFSSLAAFARREDWRGKKIAYGAALSRRGYEAMALEQGNQRGIVLDESIRVARATLAVYAEALAGRKVVPSPKDAVEMIRTLAELLKEPEGTKPDDRVIEGTARTVNADLLRRVAETARGRLATEGILAGTAPGEPERTRPN